MNARGRSARTANPDEHSNPSWEAAWTAVPAPWRTGVYRLDQEPWASAFVRNANYLRSAKAYDFKPVGSARLGQEVSWWVWTIWSEGTRKVDPAMLAWWQRAISTLVSQQTRFKRRDASAADFAPEVVIREALRQFQRKNGRNPSPGNIRNLESVAYSIHEHVTIRCSAEPWWSHDTWSLGLDPRIPRRPHEPHGHRPIVLGDIQPDWLREGLRFWLSRCLIHDVLTWTTAATRRSQIGTYFGAFIHARGVDEPRIGPDRASQRALFTEFLSWLRSPDATSNGTPLNTNSITAIQSAVQKFYDFMLESADEAAAFTADPRWLDLTGDHNRLWPPLARRQRAGNHPAPRYLTSNDMQRMLIYLDILSAPVDTRVTVGGAPHGPRISTRGLGDSQAARAWMIQALTGRRVSEILMLDYNPITMIEGATEEGDDPNAFVARLRYQQTKVDDVDPTIPVERAVVNLIREQQQWVIDAFPEVRTHPYLFLNPKSNHRGLRPRSHPSHQAALRRLDNIVNLTDTDGNPLRYTQTHRLRHTKATELLNANVAPHVVQRYLGHKSPEMTMRYAATLAATAQAEFLKYKKVGADGRDLGINPVDMYDLAQLDRRADRVLPNGYCLLPPTQSCDKGNACLSCPSFATDATHVGDHREQRDRTLALIDTRRRQFKERNGTDLPDSNVWLQARLRELASLDAILTRLCRPDVINTNVAGAGATTATAAAVPVTIVTDGAHASLLRANLERRLDQ
ncbi:tyrosine-type recombinase/integrase [Dermacoccaceae bacterium W4C1]